MNIQLRILFYTIVVLGGICFVFSHTYAANRKSVETVADKNVEIEKDIADMLDLWILNDRMLDNLEKVTITKDNIIEFRYWKARGASNVQKKYADQLKCNAFKWLFFGRTRFSKGIDEVFKKYPEFKGAKYIWFDKDIERKYDSEKGTITKTENIISYIEIYISKDKAVKNDWARAQKEMKSIDD